MLKTRKLVRFPCLLIVCILHILFILVVRLFRLDGQQPNAQPAGYNNGMSANKGREQKQPSAGNHGVQNYDTAPAATHDSAPTREAPGSTRKQILEVG